MTLEIRIYYESLEQAEYFIKPIIKPLLKKDITLKLIKLKGSYKYYSKKVAPIIFWKNPDILITLIKNGKEIPLTQIEFSSAVFTEDHELQRFDGLVASAINNCIYIKISPLNKTSSSEHGGNTNFNYIGPFATIYEKFKKIFFHFDWNCDRKGNVIVNKKYLSCPEKLTSFEKFIKELMEFIIKRDIENKNWIANFEKEIIKQKEFLEWKNKLDQFKKLQIVSLNTSRTSWNNSSKSLTLKINRFGHAMDPERGMLAYYGILCNSVISKMLFNEFNIAWYKDIPKEKEISKYISSKGLKKGVDFLYCFSLGSGLCNNNDFEILIQKFKNSNYSRLNIDLSDFIKKNYFNLNKSLRTIFKYSKCLIICDKKGNIRLKFQWKKINPKENYGGFDDLTKISKRNSLEEDDITYIVIHNILNLNKHRILAASYPGAQGDRVILVTPGTGWGQGRKYIDVVSYLPKKYTFLQENKGKYKPNPLQKEIEELSKYKNKKEYKSGINNFLKNFDKKAPQIIKIGIGFWANQNFTISKIKNLKINDLDYFIYVTQDMKDWIIWKTGNENIFNIMKGKVILPETFEVV